MLDARTHARTHGHSGDFIFGPMLCVALDRQKCLEKIILISLSCVCMLIISAGTIHAAARHESAACHPGRLQIYADNYFVQ